jgi:alpha-D-ribose 1-methylphosphonate 5-triphosphate diphosphatase
MSSQIFTNARLILADEVRAGTVAVADGTIMGIQDGGTAVSCAVDCEGDYLMPGLVDLHSDNIEKQLAPRTGVQWPMIPAVMAHDAQVAAAGITTMFDSLALAGNKHGLDRGAFLLPLLEALETARARNLLAVDHHLHIRAEVTEPDILARFDRVADHSLLRMVSLMDHTPGRQFRDVDVWMARNRVATGLSEEALRVQLARQLATRETHAASNRVALAAAARGRGLVLLSHDDTAEDDVRVGVALGVTVAEFPTTREAAGLARALGLSILMGAPNLVRGGSHVGNMSTADCTALGLLDLMASDYVPASLLQAAVKLTAAPLNLPMALAMATVTRTPARVAGLDDRGEIRTGRRADLLRFRVLDGLPRILGVWRSGERIH